MTKLAILVGGLIFAALAGLSLYRLLYWFPMSVGGAEIGQTASFFALVVCAALALILVRGALARS